MRIGEVYGNKKYFVRIVYVGLTVKYKFYNRKEFFFLPRRRREPLPNSISQIIVKEPLESFLKKLNDKTLVEFPAYYRWSVFSLK